MNPNYNQNYTREEIDTVLTKIKSCVEKNRYTALVNKNWTRNLNFFTKFSGFQTINDTNTLHPCRRYLPFLL